MAAVAWMVEGQHCCIVGGAAALSPIFIFFPLWEDSSLLTELSSNEVGWYENSVRKLGCPPPPSIFIGKHSLSHTGHKTFPLPISHWAYHPDLRLSLETALSQFCPRWQWSKTRPGSTLTPIAYWCPALNPSPLEYCLPSTKKPRGWSNGLQARVQILLLL